MSQADLSDEPAFEAPPKRRRVNIYTVMLGIALVALCLGTLMMILELSRYGFKVKAPRASLPVPATFAGVIAGVVDGGANGLS